MKVLILNASPRRKGYTRGLLKHLAGAIPDGRDVDWIEVNGLEMRPCTGCLKCRPDKECIFPEDDAHRIGRKINEADALVMGTPTYFGNMTGPLKTLIDRNLPVFEYLPANENVMPVKNQKGKKAVLVTAVNSPWPLSLLPSQGGGAVRAMKTVLQNGGYRLVGVIMLSGALAKGKIPGRVISKARSLGKRL